MAVDKIPPDTLGNFWDLDASHQLSFVWNEDDSADRDLNIKVHGASRTIDIEADSALNQDLTSDASPTFANIKIADGGNIGTSDPDAIAIASTGILSFSGQSGFSAYLSAAQDIPNFSVTTIEFDTEEFDVQNEFNTGTYTFTASTAGKYQVSACVMYNENIGDGKISEVDIYKNAGYYTYTRNTPGAASTGEVFISISMLLAANDTIQIHCYHTHTEARVLNETYCRFSIIKLT